MYKLPATLEQDIIDFGKMASEFEEGRADAVKFKVTRVPMGIYEQRKDGTYMVRIRTTGGCISPAQLAAIIGIAEKHHSNLLHITTRQEVQIQNLELKEVEPILQEVKNIGLSSKGGGGNTVRNILVPVDSGITEDEIFDTTPHAIALTSKLIAESDSFTLPRKLKIAFAGNEDKTDYAGINDLGFVAKTRDGKRGFQIYIGGSVASKPITGWMWKEFVPEEELFAVAEAVKKLFSQHGNRKNKHKARLRFIFYRLGEPEVFRLLNEYFDKARQSTRPFAFPTISCENLPEKTEQAAVFPEDPGFVHWKHRFVTPQNREGLYSVKIPFIHGNIALEKTDSLEGLKDLLRLLDSVGSDTLRFSTHQNIHLRNIPGNILPEIYDLSGRIVAYPDVPFILSNIVSCTGADTCRLGICLSKGLAAAIRKKLSESDADWDKLSDFRLQISGCPNSCGQQIWADLGFSGKALRTTRMYPAYQVFAGAKRGKELALAKSYGSIPARAVPAFVRELLEAYISAFDAYPVFSEYLEAEGGDIMRSLLEKYAFVPSFEDDKNYYFDWGADTLFSVANRGVGECSAGLFDLIDLDLNYIKQNKELLEKETNAEKKTVCYTTLSCRLPECS